MGAAAHEHGGALCHAHRSRCSPYGTQRTAGRPAALHTLPRTLGRRGSLGRYTRGGASAREQLETQRTCVVPLTRDCFPQRSQHRCHPVACKHEHEHENARGTPQTTHRKPTRQLTRRRTHTRTRTRTHAHAHARTSTRTPTHEHKHPYPRTHAQQAHTADTTCPAMRQATRAPSPAPSGSLVSRPRGDAA